MDTFKKMLPTVLSIFSVGLIMYIISLDRPTMSAWVIAITASAMLAVAPMLGE